MKFHLIGVGGVGMVAVAELLASRGQQVSGSDAVASANTARLEAIGITVHIGQAAENVDPDAAVVVSSAIKPNNPELAVARARGQRILHRSEALALAATGLDFIAVAGAHGKTSTSGMLAVALTEVGLDPSYAVGSTLPGGASGAKLGTGDVFVAEADESDGSFLNYTPAVAIVTNIEPDHLDHYGTEEAFQQAFVDFAACRVKGGLLIGCGDDEGSANLLRTAEGRRWSYGVGKQVEGTDAHISVGISGPGSATLSFHPKRGNTLTAKIRLAVPGEHMLLNAAAVWATGIELGVDPEKMARSIGTFKGTGRRFEKRGEAGGVSLYDDYAHHPTEVEATIRATAERTEGRILVLFQPHLYSRTKNFAAEFAKALDLADDVVVTGVYGAREEPMDGVEGDLITNRMVRGTFVADMHEAAAEIAKRAEPGDLILTMGAGSVTSLGPEILAQL